jgi:hypothetical protein
MMIDLEMLLLMTVEERHSGAAGTSRGLCREA